MAGSEQLHITESDIEERLLAFERTHYRLLGLASREELNRFAALLHDTINDILSASRTLSHTIPNYVLDPSSKEFNPLVAAAWHFGQQNIDEACWLLFLQCYIGKHPRYHWEFLRSIYGALDNNRPWSWEWVFSNTREFQDWLLTNQPALKETGGLNDGNKHFGFDYSQALRVGNQIQSYLSWVSFEGNHFQLFCRAIDANEGQPSASFHYLYQSMNQHVPVTKSITFNYLALISTLGIAEIQPGHLYLNDILLAKQGAKRLLGGKKVDKIPMPELNKRMITLAHYLQLPFGIQGLQKTLETYATQTVRAGNQPLIRRYK